MKKLTRAVNHLLKGKVTQEMETIIQKGILTIDNKICNYIKVENNDTISHSDMLLNFETCTNTIHECNVVSVQVDILIRTHYAEHIFNKTKGIQIIDVAISKSRVMFRKSDGQNFDLNMNHYIKEAIESRIKSLIQIK